jgi:predicted dehydrogenase
VVLTESHELDLAAWLFGAPAAVAAFGGKKSSLPGDAEDTASILLDCGFPVHVNLCFAQRPARRAIRIALEKGFIEWQGDATLRVHHADRRDWETTSDAGFERDHLFRDQVRHFLACIEGRESPRVDVAAARTSLEMALSALTQIGRSH